MTNPGKRRWLQITPDVQAALLIALLRRAGGSITMPLAELQATADITWELEATQSPVAADHLVIRLRERGT